MCVIGDLAEVQLPKGSSHNRQRYQGSVFCALCAFDQIEVDQERNAIVCGSCQSRICVLCGCVDDIACCGGCSWMAPGICSTHDGDVRLAAFAVVTLSPSVALQLANDTACKWKCACGWRGPRIEFKHNAAGGSVCPSCGASGGLILEERGFSK